MSCSGVDIFGQDTCAGAGLTPQQEQDLDDVVEKTQNQDATVGTTNFSGVLTLNGLPVGGGGGSGDVVGPVNSADNGVCFYSGVSGKIIKEVATIKYNPIPNSLAVPDLSTTVTTSLNTDLQKISNITSAIQLPTPGTQFNGAIQLANFPHSLILAPLATGQNIIESSKDLEINTVDLTMNLGGTLTEIVGNNKISIVSGNFAENIASNKVTNISASHISTASSHTFNGALTSSTSVTTPLISGVSTITNATDININNIGNDLVISNNGVVINSSTGINMTATNGGIQVGGGRITTTNVAFTNPQEMVTKKYIDDLRPTIVKFDTTINTILYEDNNIKISYLTADAQPSFELKIAPSGPGAFGTWVDTSISFIGGGSFSGTNGDATNTVGVKAFFYASTTIDPNYDHRNYGVTSRCNLCAETDLTYPTYELTLITGNIANLGVSKVEVY